MTRAHIKNTLGCAWLWASLAFAFVLSAHAFTSPSVDTLYRRALERSESVKIAAEGLSQAEEQRAQAFGSLLPNIGLSGTYLRQTALTDPLASSFSPSEQTTAKVTATQPIFHGLRDFAAYRQRNRMIEMRDHQRRVAEQQLYSDVAQAYFNHRAWLSDEKSFERELAITQERVKDLRGFQHSGRTREAEILATEASAINLEAQLDAVRGTRAVSEKSLERLVGNYHDELASELAAVQLEPLESYLKDLLRRPDILAAESDFKASDEGVAIAWGAHLPSIDLVGNYYFSRAGLLAQINWDIQAVATFPLFAGGVIQSQVREAVSQRKGKELAWERLKRIAEEEIRGLHALVQTEVTRVERLKRAAELTEKTHLVEKRSFRSGLATNLEVLQAGATAQQTLRAYERARINAVWNWVKIEIASGRKPNPSTR